MAKAHRKESASRAIFSVRLLQSVLNSGRKLKCEVLGCENTCVETHHIVPVSVQPNHSPDNIAILCKTHHALVERFYWQSRCEVDSETCAELRKVAIGFKTRTIPQDEIQWFEAKSKKLWTALNTNEMMKHPSFWAVTFSKAKRWVRTVEVLKEVDSKDAITEDPWFRKKVRPDLKIISVI